MCLGGLEIKRIFGVSDASYHQEENAVAGEIILLGNRKTMAASPMYWKSGVIRKVCLSPKAAETRSLVRLVDDSLLFEETVGDNAGSKDGDKDVHRFEATVGVIRELRSDRREGIETVIGIIEAELGGQGSV